MAPPGLSAGSRVAPGSPSRSGRTRCGMRSSPPGLTPGSRYRMSRKPPRMPTRTTMRYDRARGGIDRHATDAYLVGADPTSRGQQIDVSCSAPGVTSPGLRFLCAILWALTCGDHPSRWRQWSTSTSPPSGKQPAACAHAARGHTAAATGQPSRKRSHAKGGRP